MQKLFWLFLCVSLAGEVGFAEDGATTAQSSTPSSSGSPATPSTNTSGTQTPQSSTSGTTTPSANNKDTATPKSSTEEATKDEAAPPPPADKPITPPNFRDQQPEPEVEYSNDMTRAINKHRPYSTVRHANPMTGRYIPPQGFDDYSGPANDYDGKDAMSAKEANLAFPQFNYTPANNCKIKSSEKGEDRTLTRLWPNTASVPQNYDCDANKMKANRPDSFTCMVCNIFFEAGQEPPEGQVEVGRTTLTRVFNKRWPGSVCKVVYQANGKVAQFSWTYEHKDHHLPNGKALEKVVAAARRAMELGPNCLSNYWSPGGMKPKGSSPDWAGQCSPKSKFGIQLFCPIGDTQPNRSVAQVAAEEGRSPFSPGVGGSPADATH